MPIVQLDDGSAWDPEALIQRAPMDAASVETTAMRFIRALELGDGVNHPLTIASIVGAVLRGWGRRACGAAMTYDPELVIRVPLDAPLAVLARVLAHELAHLAADFDGIPRPHDERWIDHLAAAIWLGRRAIRRALAIAGWDAPALMRLFGEVPADMLLRRVAIVGEGVAIVRSALCSRRIYAPEHIPVNPNTRRWEHRILRAVRDGGAQRGFFGEGAWGLSDPVEGRTSVILIPPDALDHAEEHTIFAQSVA